jgi:hypothetical protein
MSAACTRWEGDASLEASGDGRKRTSASVSPPSPAVGGAGADCATYTRWPTAKVRLGHRVNVSRSDLPAAQTRVSTIGCGQLAAGYSPPVLPL